MKRSFFLSLVLPSFLRNNRKRESHSYRLHTVILDFCVEHKPEVALEKVFVEEATKEKTPKGNRVFEVYNFISVTFLDPILLSYHVSLCLTTRTHTLTFYILQ